MNTGKQYADDDQRQHQGAFLCPDYNLTVTLFTLKQTHCKHKFYKTSLKHLGKDSRDVSKGFRS
jgi:hypothetical protein